MIDVSELSIEETAQRGDPDGRAAPPRRAAGDDVSRDLSEKGPVPLHYWAMWWASLSVAIVAFYVVLTPIWIGIRVAGWLAPPGAARRCLWFRAAAPRAAASEPGSTR